MTQQTPLIRRPTWIAVLLVTLYHCLAILLLGERLPVVWFDLPALAVVAGLALLGRVAPELPLCYAGACFCLLGDPAVGFFPSSWLMPVPLLFVVERVKGWRSLAAWGLWTGAMGASGIYAWIWRAVAVFFEFGMAASFPLYFLATLAIGLQLAVFFPLARWMSDRLGRPVAVVGALLYTVVEYWMPLPMPIALSMGFIATPFLLQPADLIGMYGVSFLAAVVGCATFHALQSALRRDRTGMIRGGTVAVAVLVLHIGYSAWCWSAWRDDPKSPSIDMAMIQPMGPLKVKNDDVTTQERGAAVLKALSLEAVAGAPGRPDLLLWPEGAGAFASRTPEFNPPYMRAVRDIQQATSVTLLVHDVEFTRLPGQEKIRYYSTVSMVAPVGRVVQSYCKNILMPFGEYLPLERQLPFLRKWLPEARSILPAKNSAPLDGPGGPFAPLICYEVLFPDYVRRLVGPDCRYIVNLTNDRWYGRRQEPVQHQGFAILRAIENRKPVARDTNTGVSALIDARGAIASRGQTPVMVKTWLRGRLQPRAGRTLYNRFGDVLHPWILTPLALVLPFYVYISRPRGEGPKTAGKTLPSRSPAGKPKTHEFQRK